VVTNGGGFGSTNRKRFAPRCAFRRRRDGKCGKEGGYILAIVLRANIDASADDYQVLHGELRIGQSISERSILDPKRNGCGPLMAYRNVRMD
jgi:hypothetical protein